MSVTHYCANCLTTFTDDSNGCPNLGCRSHRPSVGWGVVLGPGDLLDRRYRVIRALAVGGAGLTYVAREVDNSGVAQPPDLAIKVLYAARATGPFLRRLANEAQILQELDHPNIVKCHGFVHRTGQEPYLVTLLEHGGSLSEHVERLGALPVSVAAGITRQILLALDVAHQRGVVHRDLKPDNILLCDRVARDITPHIRVADFGIAKVEGGLNKLTKLGAFVGTPEYAAPEQFEAQVPTPATDVFAAGGVLYGLLTGSPPVKFSQRNDIEQSYDELLDQIPPKLNLLGDAQQIGTLQNCVDNMMMADAAKRWTVHQVIAELNKIVDPPRRPPHDTISTTASGSPPREVIKDGTLHQDPGATFAVDDLPGATPEAIADIIARNTPAPLKERRQAPPKIAAEAPPPPPKDEGPPPPPPKATPTPEPPAVPEISPEPVAPTPIQSEPPKRRGWLGLGLAGMTLLLIGGSLLAILALVGAAFAFGWFGPAPVLVAELPAITLETREPVTLLGNTKKKWVAERKALVSALQKKRSAIAKTCKVQGLTAFKLVVDGDGSVQQVEPDEGYLTSKQSTCVSAEISKIKLPRQADDPAILRAALLLK
jgi:eukaryotic-like serine/threonine-protein kinase